MNINYWCPWRRHNLKLNENEESNIHDFSHSLALVFLFLWSNFSSLICRYCLSLLHRNHLDDLYASSVIKERQMNINIFTSRLCSRNTSKLDSFWFSFKSEQTGIDIDVDDDCCIRHETRLSCCKSSAVSKTSRVLWLNHDSSIQSICISNIDFHRADQIARIHSKIICVAFHFLITIIQSERNSTIQWSNQSSTRSCRIILSWSIFFINRCVWSCWHLTEHIHMVNEIIRVIKSLPMSSTQDCSTLSRVLFFWIIDSWTLNVYDRTLLT